MTRRNVPQPRIAALARSRGLMIGFARLVKFD